MRWQVRQVNVYWYRHVYGPWVSAGRAEDVLNGTVSWVCFGSEIAARPAAGLAGMLRGCDKTRFQWRC